MNRLATTHAEYTNLDSPSSRTRCLKVSGKPENCCTARFTAVLQFYHGHQQESSLERRLPTVSFEMLSSCWQCLDTDTRESPHSSSTNAHDVALEHGRYTAQSKSLCSSHLEPSHTSSTDCWTLRKQWRYRCVED